MRKIWVWLLAAVLLTGCSTKHADLNQRLQSALSEAVRSELNGKPDNIKTLYSYYVEPSVGRRSSTAASNVFVKDGQEFVMNLNTAQIVNEKLYAGAAVEQLSLSGGEVLAQSQGETTDVSGAVLSYSAVLSTAENGRVMVTLTTRHFTFTGQSDQTAAPSLAGEMLKIARTAKADEEAVINAYTSRNKISYVKQNLNLFEDEIPESGPIEEMMTDKTHTTGDSFDQSGETFESGTNADDLPLNEDDSVPAESE